MYLIRKIMCFAMFLCNILLAEYNFIIVTHIISTETYVKNQINYIIYIFLTLNLNIYSLRPNELYTLGSDTETKKRVRN